MQRTTSSHFQDWLARAPTLGSLCAGRDNNFNLIRILAALAVIVSHAFPISLGPEAAEPLDQATGYTLGWIAVAVFFAISGFLITRSFDRTARLADWTSARVMRLFPGLAVVLILTAALYGPAFTTLPLESYFTDPATYTYVPRNLSLAFLQFGLPGVFQSAPLPLAINGSLWTLVHEVACYFGVFVIGVAGLLRGRRAFAVVCALYFASYIFTGLPDVERQLFHQAVELRKLSLPFVMGMMLYHWRDTITLSGVGCVLLFGLSWLLNGSPGFDIAFMAAISYATFVLAYRVRGRVRAYNRLGDYSYGLYIYGFPVQQAVAAMGWSDGPIQNMLIAFPMALTCAVISWYAVERPALDRRDRFAAALQTIFNAPRTFWEQVRTR